VNYFQEVIFFLLGRIKFDFLPIFFNEFVLYLVIIQLIYSLGCQGGFFVGFVLKINRPTAIARIENGIAP
jgi:hypothetical protein